MTPAGASDADKLGETLDRAAPYQGREGEHPAYEIVRDARGIFIGEGDVETRA